MNTNNPIKISEAEFKLTKQFIDLMDLNVESDFTITLEDCITTLTCGEREVYFAERYSSLPYIPAGAIIFRPFKNEKHANLIISMFDRLECIDYDFLEIEEYEVNGKPKYSGWLTKNDKKIEESFVKISPSIPILKMSIVAAIMMDEDEHDDYMKNLMAFLGKHK